MTTLNTTAPQLVQGVKVQAGTATTLRLQAVVRIGLAGFSFDTGKCFVQPTALPALRSLKIQYDLRPRSKLLIVGHTDSAGEEDANLDLSLERAEALAAYLTDKVEAWEAWFEDGKPAAKRWGAREVQWMLTALPEGGEAYYAGTVDGSQGQGTVQAIRKFQEAAGLKVDGIAGPKTRNALITAYMKLDGTTLPAGISPVAHGCGESFPAGQSAAASRTRPASRRSGTAEPGGGSPRGGLLLRGAHLPRASRRPEVAQGCRRLSPVAQAGHGNPHHRLSPSFPPDAVLGQLVVQALAAQPQCPRRLADVAAREPHRALDPFHFQGHHGLVQEQLPGDGRRGRLSGLHGQAGRGRLAPGVFAAGRAGPAGGVPRVTEQVSMPGSAPSAAPRKSRRSPRLRPSPPGCGPGDPQGRSRSARRSC